MSEAKEVSEIAPTVLPNGVEVVNMTAHPLLFWHDYWEAPVEVPVSYILNAWINTHTEWRGRGYVVVSLSYKEKEGDRLLLELVANQYPNAVLVGSIIAAEVYQGLVVSPSYYTSKREERGVDKSKRYVKANRFTTIKPRGANNGSSEKSST